MLAAARCVMRLAILRSAWGLSHLRTAEPARALDAIAAARFDGLEASLDDLGAAGDAARARAWARAASERELALVLSAYSSWPNYEGECDSHKPIGAHLDTLERALAEIAEMHAGGARGSSSAVLGVNAHSGADSWTEAEGAEFFAQLGARVGGLDVPRLSHETHRARFLRCPFVTRRLLRAHPWVRLTVDLSHWVVVAERLLSSAPEEAMLREEIAPACDHVHARVGTPQAPQVAEPTARACARASERFHSFWAQVWSARERAALSGRDGVLSATVEYGPLEWGGADGAEYVGYTPATVDGRAPLAGHGLDETVARAAAELRCRFEAWHARAAERTVRGCGAPKPGVARGLGAAA